MSAIADLPTQRLELTSAATAASAWRTFNNIAEVWQLSVAEQTTLLGISRATLYQWRQGRVPPLDRNVLERLSYLFGIYKALHILFSVAAHANSWIRAPNSAPLFGGRSALDRMLSGHVADLYVVRQYLDAQLEGKA